MAFGYRFLGPFLLDWHNRLALKTAGHAADTIYCLGREGWGIVPLFNTIESFRTEPRRRFVYLQVSRSLMTHISLADPRLWQFGFNSRFDGTVHQFCEARLAVPFDLLDLGPWSSQRIQLPRDRAFLLHLFERSRAAAVMMAERSRTAYRRYLDAQGLVPGKPHILLDLGFRGTTQALLSGVYDLDITGFYALLDPSGVPAPLELKPGSTHGLFADDRSFGDGYGPLDQSLLFEAIFTAPFGQVSGIQDRVVGDPFLYRDGGAPQRNYANIAGCFQGAQKFVLDHSDLIGSDVPLIDNLEAFFEAYRAAMAGDLETFGPILELDDSFFGTDTLNAEFML